MSENQLVKQEDANLFLDVGAFEHGQRVATMLSKTTMVPEIFKNNVGNCMIALNFAKNAGLDPFMAMQKMYIIHGKPAVETQLLVAMFNRCNRFTPLKHKLAGEGDDWRCVAYATEKESGEVVQGPAVSIGMAKSEGWHGKNGSKWQTMPEVMLRYRASAFFIRTYAPEAAMGMYSREEMEDIKSVDAYVKSGEENIDMPKNDIHLQKEAFDKAKADMLNCDNADQLDKIKNSLDKETLGFANWNLIDQIYLGCLEDFSVQPESAVEPEPVEDLGDDFEAATGQK